MFLFSCTLKQTVRFLLRWFLGWVICVVTGNGLNNVPVPVHNDWELPIIFNKLLLVDLLPWAEKNYTDKGNVGRDPDSVKYNSRSVTKYLWLHFFASLPWDYPHYHYDPAAHQDHCGRCRIRCKTQDLCPRSLVRYQWATTSPWAITSITCGVTVFRS